MEVNKLFIITETEVTDTTYFKLKFTHFILKDGEICHKNLILKQMLPIKNLKPSCG